MTQSALTPFDRGRPAALAAGDVLCARFEILQFLAQGGMGEVYEARDLELGETVALKTIRPEIADDPRVLHRFRREITLARKVTHPNVCRIFDVFHHPAPDGSGRSTTFLAMEMLRGETLAARLRRSGPLTTEEALPLVEQMAKGLQAAHQAGIVHRDLKPGNVILVANGRGDRVVITDFGLAHGEDQPGSSSTGALGMVGTSAYMSPEQVEGHDVTAASDIFSLGVVLYEMVTGVKPFFQDTALATAVMRLKGAPASPRVHRPDLDPRWERAILRCLEVSPADRFGSADEVVAGLAHARRSRPVVYTTFAAMAVALALASLVPWRGGASAPSPAPVAAPRRSVAVLGFKNLSGRAESAWLSTALSEMLGMELAAGEALRIIPGENVARMKVELALTDADSLAPDTLARIRANLGTDLVVLGSYLAQGEKAGERLRLDLRVQDTAAGELVASITETGTEAELLDFVSRGGHRLRATLGIAQTGAARASFPSNPQAARLYSEGLARLRAFDALGARDLLQKAVAADSTNPLAHAALAEAWSALGYDAKAKREAQAALDLSARLTREERLTVEGRHYAISSQWDQAIDTYRLLWSFFPDNVEYGLRLAAAQSGGGRGQEALETVEAMRRSGAADPRIDLADAVAAGSLSDFKRKRAAAARAVQRSEAQKAPLLAAQARRQAARALSDLGEYPAAIAMYEEARRTFAQAGDRREVAAVLSGMGVAYWRQERLDDAEALFDQALAINRTIGHQSGVAQALTGLGAIFSRREDHAAAGAHYEAALAIHREIGDRTGIATALHNIAYTYRHREDLATATRLYRESLTLSREVGNRSLTGSALNMLGWIAMDRGELGSALAPVKEALAISRQIGYRTHEAYNLFNIGRILLARGDFDGARQRQEESLRIRRQIGETGNAMENQVALAAILLEQNRAAEAEALAREAVDHFQTASDVTKELLGRAVLIRCLLAQGKLGDARQSAARAMAVAKKSQSQSAPHTVAISVARVEAAAGQAATAMRSLERIIAEARRTGFGWLELEARLALGEIEMKHGRAAAGRARLEAVEKDATAKGCVLIARKAAQHGQTVAGQ